MVQICEDVHIPASASVLIAATCLEIKWRFNLVHILFFLSLFFLVVLSFDSDMMNQIFSPPKTLLHSIMESRWVFCQHFARLLFITFVKMDSIVLLHWKNRVWYRPAHSWVELGYTLLQRGCGKRSDLQVANCILQPFTILLDLVIDDDDSGD